MSKGDDFGTVPVSTGFAISVTRSCFPVKLIVKKSASIAIVIRIPYIVESIGLTEKLHDGLSNSEADACKACYYKFLQSNAGKDRERGLLIIYPSWLCLPNESELLCCGDHPCRF